MWHICLSPKAFHTVFQNILLKKLDHYGLRGISNKWFEICLTNRKQFVIINGSNLNVSTIVFGVLLGSVLGPLLFLINIITNLILLSNIVRSIILQQNRQISPSIKNLKIGLISIKYVFSKTEMVLFRLTRKNIDVNLKLKPNGKRLYQTNSVKYLGLEVDNKLNWSVHIKDRYGN